MISDVKDALSELRRFKREEPRAQLLLQRLQLLMSRAMDCYEELKMIRQALSSDQDDRVAAYLLARNRASRDCLRNVEWILAQEKSEAEFIPVPTGILDRLETPEGE